MRNDSSVAAALCFYTFVLFKTAEAGENVYATDTLEPTRNDLCSVAALYQVVCCRLRRSQGDDMQTQERVYDRRPSESEMIQKSVVVN